MHTRFLLPFTKAFLIACCCCLALPAFTQTAADSIFIGAGPFRLGDPQSKFGNDLVLAMDSSNNQDVTDPKYSPYPYRYKGPKPIYIDPEVLTIESFIVMFDEKKTLAWLLFMNLYGVGHGHSSARKGKKDYKRLVSYFNDKTKQSGKKMTYRNSKTLVIEGYEWETPQAKIVVEIQDPREKDFSITIYLKKK